MPINLNVDHEHSQVSSVAVGAVSFDDIRTHLSLERLSESLSYPELIDTRGAALTLTSEDVARIAELFLSRSREAHLGRTAILVDSDSAFGLVLALETLVRGVCEVRPFRKEQKARAWLAA